MNMYIRDTKVWHRGLFVEREENVLIRQEITKFATLNEAFSMESTLRIFQIDSLFDIL